MKTDCFAYAEGKCTDLINTECENCVFYKTKKECCLDRLRALERISFLKDKDLQTYINNTYYNGRLFEKYKLLTKEYQSL